MHPQPYRPVRRQPFAPLLFLAAALLLGLYFAFAAVQGKSGILRRVQLQAEMVELQGQRDALKAQVERMQNLTRRLSDQYLDLDLLDERARNVLGLARGDELVTPRQ